jgi:hypothetical protein
MIVDKEMDDGKEEKILVCFDILQIVRYATPPRTRNESPLVNQLRIFF